MVAVLSGWLSQSVPMCGLVQVVLVVALWRLWIPVSYELGSGGIVQQVLTRRRHLDWLVITRAQLQDRGVLLLVDRSHVPLAAIHGVFIPWRDKRREVLALIEYFIATRIELADKTHART